MIKNTINAIIFGVTGFYSNKYLKEYDKMSLNKMINFEYNNLSNIPKNFKLYDYYKNKLIKHLFKSEDNNTFIFNTKTAAQGHKNINHGGFTGLLIDFCNKEFIYNYIKQNNLHLYQNINLKKNEIFQTKMNIMYKKPILVNKNYSINILETNYNKDNHTITVKSNITKDNELYCQNIIEYQINFN